MRVRAPLCWWTLRRFTHDKLVQHFSTIAEWGYLEFLHHRVEARTKFCDAAKGPQGYLWSSDGARSFTIVETSDVLEVRSLCVAMWRWSRTARFLLPAR